ncbi:MAG: ATP-dependent DNA helicase RecG [Candidatus Omnitrophota bacterium]|jgi:ATP-dependent DNA helicase RecG
MTKRLDTPIQYLKGVGPKRAKLFARRGINSIEDLLYYFPRRYEDRRKFSPVAQLKEGEGQTIKARILRRAERRSFKRRGFSIMEVTAGDGSGKVFCVWFNQPYLKEYFKPGIELILYGKVERYGQRLQMSNPEFEIISSDGRESLDIGRIVPVYGLPDGITQRYFRRAMKQALDEYLPALNDFLPFDIRSRNELLNLAKSLINIHFPGDFTLQKEAFRRLSFEEFLLFQLPLSLRKLSKKEKPGIAHQVEGGLIKSFISGLPFRLTAAQEKVTTEIKQDMAASQPMQRLLQGDVGSGKTVVAAIAGLMAIQGGYQAAFMVPTELLARQHFEKINSQLSGVRAGGRKIKTGLLAGSISEEEKKRIYEEIKEGETTLVIGTHALLEEKVKFKNLGLVVIDEQHKFGVGQRALLPQKGLNPDVLIMTATPIPRTLAITLYGDLDISVLNELPAGRLPVKTLHFNGENKLEAYRLAREQLRKGYQAYIIYPVIEESFVLDIAGCQKMYAELKTGEFKEFRLGLIHGRLKQKEQDALMRRFKEKELDALVATTVLEVGIDIPEATCMLIEHAERFGLSQLHQLRGRVGRGTSESFCILISGAKTPEAKARLEAMLKYNDGFRIAEEDLKIRGPGEFFGARQHGLVELKIGNPLTQMRLLKRSREEALRLVKQDPSFKTRQNLLLKEKLLQRFPGYERLMVIG